MPEISAQALVAPIALLCAFCVLLLVALVLVDVLRERSPALVVPQLRRFRRRLRRSFLRVAPVRATAG